jgi:hypothetical protein
VRISIWPIPNDSLADSSKFWPIPLNSEGVKGIGQGFVESARNQFLVELWWIKSKQNPHF